jgi:hypothetical protein
MTLFLVIAFCVAVVLQLHTISQHLERMGGTTPGGGAHSGGGELSQLKEELRAIHKVIAGQVEEMRAYLKDELQCYNDVSFAHDLRDQLREIPEKIVEEIETTAANISEALENQLDGLKAIEAKLSNMESSLSNMEASLSSIDVNTGS